MKLGPKKRVTQADVAGHAGVSQALVSYVINQSDAAIPQQTRQRIQDAMTRLGYVPNVTAQRLRANKTTTIAGIIPDIINPFYPAFERGVQDVVDCENYDFIIYNTDGKEDKEKKVVASLLQGRVDGIVGVFFHLSNHDLLPLIEQGIAVVRLEAMPGAKDRLALDGIGINNVAAATAAVNHLIQRGHTRIGMLASQDGPSRFRTEGYKEALVKHNIQPQEGLICTGSYNEEGGHQAMWQLLQLATPPTAIFAVNDLMAMGAMLAIREAGLQVPADIAVVGFDDIPSAKLVTPALSSVSQKQKQIGQRAAAMLFERLRGEFYAPGRSEEVPFELMIRQSS